MDTAHTHTENTHSDAHHIMYTNPQSQTQLHIHTDTRRRGKRKRKHVHCDTDTDKEELNLRLPPLKYQNLVVSQKGPIDNKEIHSPLQAELLRCLEEDKRTQSAVKSFVTERR